MTSKPNNIKLLVFTDQEFTTLCERQTLDLSEKLLEMANAWLANHRGTPPDEAPSAYAVGAAFYAALWKLSNESPSRLEAMRKGCAIALLNNDAETRAYISIALAPIPDYMN